MKKGTLTIPKLPSYAVGSKIIVMGIVRIDDNGKKYISKANWVTIE